MAEYKSLTRDSSEADTLISTSIINKVKAIFPISGNFFTVNLSNITLEKSKTGLGVVKDALVGGSTVSNKVKATVILKNKEGKVVDSKRRLIMTIPAFTKKGSFVVGGNSYVLPLQQRLRPGVYTMEKRNGAIETMFNLSKGRNFTIKIGTKGAFNVKIGSAHISLYSLLKFLGTSDEAMKTAWGEELYKQNQSTYSSSDAEKFLKLFSYDVKNIEKENLIEQVREEISKTQVDEASVNATLGVSGVTSVNSDLLLIASKKLLKVYNNKEKPDDRENMMFKQIVTPEAMLAEAFEKKSRELISKIKFKLSNPNTQSVDEVLGIGGLFLGRPIKDFIVSSKASIMPEEYNPIMMHMANHLITPLGEGGVGDTRALNLDTKAVHPSHLGFIDPIVSPEGASVGITLAVTENAYVDENGVPAMGVINAKTGKKEIVPLDKLWKSKVAYPVSKERIKEDGVMVRQGAKDFKAKNRRDVEYVIGSASDMHAPSTNLLGFVMNGIDANRANMGQKHTQQALSLTKREVPNISSTNEEGEDYTGHIAVKSNHIPSTKKGGVVVKITKNEVHVQNKDGAIEKIEYVKDLPLARKTFINHELSVKKGDKLKAGQSIADSNFTKDGKMALGINMEVAWLSMNGNRNDGIVVSESSAEELTSEHMYKENITLDPSDIADFRRFTKMFPQEVSKWNSTDYDEHGVIRKGVSVVLHQPLMFILKKADAKQLMSRMEKVMMTPYKAKIITWHHEDSGTIVESKYKGRDVRLNIKVKSKLKVGDKVAARQGNKGVVTRIERDENMPYNPVTGKKVKMTMTAAGVISRTNGGQLIEAGLGKISDKTGKRYIFNHYEKNDNLAFMESEANKHKVEMKETLINPTTGKPFPKKIFVGKPFVMKLFKDGESGMSAVGVGATDINEQPVKGGGDSAASYSNMEVNALLAYGAKSLAEEAKHVKGQKNDEFFDAFRRGMPTPPPAENFASAKFRAYLEQMRVGVKTHHIGSEFSLIPLVDKDITAKSGGKIKNAETIYAKNGKPVKGGLFDDNIFGGASKGNRFSHIDLGTKIINPIYKEHTARLLNMTEKQLTDEVEQKGIARIEKRLAGIDPAKKIGALKREITTSRNPQIANRNIKSIMMLEKTLQGKRTVPSVALMSKVPIIPPKYRPASRDANGDISINDLNLHYQDIFALSDAIKKSKGLTKKTRRDLEKDLYKSVGAMYGLEESPNKKMKDKGIKGVLDILSGDTPKQSYAQQNMLRVKQFMSGRGVIVPARKDITINEIEIPEKMGLKMYEPHISRDLSRMGKSPLEVKEMIEKKDPLVIQSLHRLGKDIPVVYNRAPTLWKHGIIGAHPKFVKGSVIGMNPLTEDALNSDYDGDQIGVHVPVEQKAINDVKEKMLYSQNIFNDRTNHLNPSLLPLPTQDSSLGIYKASVPSGTRRTPIRVASMAELKSKLSKGEIQYNDVVSVG